MNDCTVYPILGWNSWPSCLGFMCGRIADMCLHVHYKICYCAKKGVKSALRDQKTDRKIKYEV